MENSSASPQKIKNTTTIWSSNSIFGYIFEFEKVCESPCSQFSSIQSLSCVHLFATPWTAACQVYLSMANSRIYSNWCPLSWSCHPVISSSVILFSSCVQYFPASGSFPTSQLFASGDQSIGASASAAVLPMNIQDWSPLGWTGWISCCPGDSQESSPAPQFESINSSLLLLFCFFRSPYFGNPLTEHGP